MNPRISQSYNEIKTNVQTSTERATSRATESLSRTWGHIVQHLSPSQTNRTQAQVNTTFQTVTAKQNEEPKNNTQLKGLPKTPAEIRQAKQAKATQALQNAQSAKIRAKELPKNPAQIQQARAAQALQNAQSAKIQSKELPKTPTEIQQAKNAETQQARADTALKNALMEKEIRNQMIASNMQGMNHVHEAPVKAAQKPVVHTISNQPVQDLSEKAEAKIKDELHIKPQENPLKAEFSKLKDTIDSLTSKKKLKLDENAELTIKNRNQIKTGREEIGTSEKSQAAINGAVNQLIKFASKDLPAGELLSVVNSLKENEWGKEALTTDPVKKNFPVLENFLNAKIKMQEMKNEYDKLNDRYFALDPSLDLDDLEEKEKTLMRQTLLHDNLKKGIDELAKKADQSIDK